MNRIKWLLLLWFIFLQIAVFAQESRNKPQHLVFEHEYSVNKIVAPKHGKIKNIILMIGGQPTKENFGWITPR